MTTTTTNSTRRFARLSDRLGAYGVTAVLGLGAIGGFVQQCSPPPPPPILQVAGVQDAVVASVNRHRASAGVGGLAVDPRLAKAAQGHSDDMANRWVMSHTGSDGRNAGERIWLNGYGAATWAENVAAGQTTADQVMQAWMNSSGHRANILNGRMVHIGVAATQGSNGVVYWTMVLAG